MSKSFPRRQIIKITLTLVIGLATTSLASFLIPKSVSLVQAIVVKQPNEFELNGVDTQIKYSVNNEAPQLDYRGPKINHLFSGQEIQTLTTDFGTVITVIISRPNPDVGGNIVKLSLLLPIVNLPLGNGGESRIQTYAIVTTQKTVGNIRRPLFGQIQEYQTLVLKGTAH